jgi:hypothetical protein
LSDAEKAYEGSFSYPFSSAYAVNNREEKWLRWKQKNSGSGAAQKLPTQIVLKPEPLSEG